ncbi:MAG: hypothetical protein ACLP3R_10990 [Candidatus Korobacteraceae bacterium]
MTTDELNSALADAERRASGFQKRIERMAAGLVLKASEKARRRLQLESERRGITETALALSILEAVANDGLFNAVLDN